MIQRAPAPSPGGATGAAGLTLIEVLVALFITSIVLLAGLRSLGLVLQTSSALGPRLAAQWSADNALAQLYLDQSWPALGESSSDCSQGSYQLTCRLSVSETPNPGFHRVDVQVMEGGGEGGVVLAHEVTLIAKSIGGWL